MKKLALIAAFTVNTMAFGATLNCSGKQFDYQNTVVGTYFFKAEVLSNSAITKVQIAYVEEGTNTAPDFTNSSDKVVIADQTYNPRKYGNYNRFNVAVLADDESWSTLLLPTNVLSYPQFYAYVPWGAESAGGTQRLTCTLE